MKRRQKMRRRNSRRGRGIVKSGGRGVGGRKQNR